jgi:MoxR-like ATPase
MDTKNTNIDIRAINEKIEKESAFIDLLLLEMNKVIVGQKHMLERLLIGLLGNGHILLEGVPGLAKTLAINTLSKSVKGSFSRVQFTPDLLPADVIGTMIYNMKENDFSIKKGPIFANFVLADEINRAPAKVQSALLEAMQEHQVTIGNHTFKLDEPFLVFATQNPIEQEGTYRLPEAQVDRFLFKILINYPTIQEERELLKRSLDLSCIHRTLTHDDIVTTQHFIHDIYLDDKVADYILSIVFATRKPEEYKLKEIKPFIQYGVSPRATLALYRASKAHAFLKRRHFVTPDDVKAVCPVILRHRLILTYEAEADGICADILIQKILTMIPAP